MPEKSERLDILLMEICNVPSREKAKQLIMAGEVLVNNQVADKPSKLVSRDSVITIQNTCPYVSRGGYKLEKALKYFNIDVKGKIAIDIGSSTGGFTDCLLQNGAVFVYAVDVGYGQLDWKLRNDQRVGVFERTNIRYVKPDLFNREIDIATIDVSFISLDKVIPVVYSLISDNGQVIALIKPQFEAGKKLVGKGGVVKDAQTHYIVIRNVCEMAIQNGFEMKGITYSPIKGPSGNIEYLIYLQKSKNRQDIYIFDDIINKVVIESHNILNN
jgi:23S rRNA (cytidine1920-2'-O)/16S rRNA (cytidine1409-2'-O)-methyltransferase